MVESGSVSILVPTQLQGQHNAFLAGSFASSACAEEDRTAYVVVVTQADPSLMGSVGRIANGSTEALFPSHSQGSVWVTLQTHPHLTLTSVRILGRPISLSEVNLVTYDSEEVCESELVARRFPFNKDHDHANDIVPYFIHCVQRDVGGRRPAEGRAPFTLVVSAVATVFLAMSWLPRAALQALHITLVSRLDYSSNSLRQILLRISQVEKIRDELRSRRRGLLYGRLMAMIALDVLLGVAIAGVISSHASVHDMYSSFCDWTKLLATTVHRLLEWLSGAPAGLKLNQPLTQALSAFFSYHVHLWKLYLELADPVLRGLAWVLVWVGMCGASVQVAILSDLLDLATLHLYCFYIYGARIHNLQISLLGSQWRAFRGRKWNPLKQRVDTYDAGGHISLRRVLTAVVFTLVVFLLPTTTIYYLVFLLLRVALNLTRGALQYVIWMLNVNPLYLVLLNISGSNRVKGDIYFSTVPAGDLKESTRESPLLLSLHTWPSSLSNILAEDDPDNYPQRPSPDWRFFLSSLMFGEHLL